MKMTQKAETGTELGKTRSKPVKQAQAGQVAGLACTKDQAKKTAINASKKISKAPTAGITTGML
jgi:hypothetical protein